MSDYVYSGIDYLCAGCKKRMPLMVVGDVFQKGKRWLILRPHNRVDGEVCVSEDILISVQELMPKQSQDII